MNFQQLKILLMKNESRLKDRILFKLDQKHSDPASPEELSWNLEVARGAKISSLKAFETSSDSTRVMFFKMDLFVFRSDSQSVSFQLAIYENNFFRSPENLWLLDNFLLIKRKETENDK